MAEIDKDGSGGGSETQDEKSQDDETQTRAPAADDARNSGGKEIAGIIFPPPLIYLGFLAAGLIADYFWPFPLLPNNLQYAIGAILIAAAFMIVIPAFANFRKAGTPVDPYNPTTAIVVTGSFRFSRNPIYLALSLLYTGIAICADSIWVLGLLLPVLAVMNFGVILREERYLEDKFGDEYRRYKSSVRRWL